MCTSNMMSQSPSSYGAQTTQNLVELLNKGGVSYNWVISTNVGDKENISEDAEPYGLATIFLASFLTST